MERTRPRAAKVSVAQPRRPTGLDGRVCGSGRRKGVFRDSQRMTRQCRTRGQGGIRDSFAKLALNISKARQMGISTACFDLKLDALLMFTDPFSSSSSSSSFLEDLCASHVHKASSLSPLWGTCAVASICFEARCSSPLLLGGLDW